MSIIYSRIRVLTPLINTSHIYNRIYIKKGTQVNKHKMPHTSLLNHNAILETLRNNVISLSHPIYLHNIINVLHKYSQSQIGITKTET